MAATSQTSSHSNAAAIPKRSGLTPTAIVVATLSMATMAGAIFAWRMLSAEWQWDDDENDDWDGELNRWDLEDQSASSK